jgi:hypothetical protein
MRQDSHQSLQYQLMRSSRPAAQCLARGARMTVRDQRPGRICDQSHVIDEPDLTSSDSGDTMEGRGRRIWSVTLDAWTTPLPVHRLAQSLTNAVDAHVPVRESAERACQVDEMRVVIAKQLLESAQITTIAIYMRSHAH